MVNCETCNGTGHVIIEHRRLICEDCDGRGERHLVPKGDYSTILDFEKGRIKK